MKLKTIAALDPTASGTAGATAKVGIVATIRK